MNVSSRHAYLALASAGIATVAVFLAVLLYTARSEPEIVISSASDSGEIVISVTGAVAAPGVFTLPAGARVVDALEAAGGTTPDADLSGLNLAERLRDEQRLVVPSLSSAGTPTALGIQAEPGTGRIDINRASAEQLDELPGIGPAIAARIIAYREANGPFTRVEELARVDGISPAMVDELRPLITAEP